MNGQAPRAGPDPESDERERGCFVDDQLSLLHHGCALRKLRNSRNKKSSDMARHR
jgi:hypothetical protein